MNNRLGCHVVEELRDRRVRAPVHLFSRYGQVEPFEARGVVPIISEEIKIMSQSLLCPTVMTARTYLSSIQPKRYMGPRKRKTLWTLLAISDK